MKTLEQIRADEIFVAKVSLVTETMAKVFGPLELNVVFQAVANWTAVLIFNTNGTPMVRREVLRRFNEQMELAITAREQGQIT